jgi:uncharacterized protein (TIGR02996 family)
VTDDEAFIRRIVSSPGDDTPRLVYADWLDERGDPRGGYLRAEVEWAKPWRSHRRPRNKLALWKSRARMDPLWAARICRPPLGVCCDHLSLNSSRIAALEFKLDEAESVVDVAVPTQLRALILNYTLGCLKDWPLVTRVGVLGDLVIDSFVCLSNPDQAEDQVSNELVERTVWLRDEYGLDHEYLYLASTSNDTTFVVSVRESFPGAVCVLNGSDTEVAWVSETIGVFLAMLRTQTRPITNTRDRPDPTLTS